MPQCGNCRNSLSRESKAMTLLKKLRNSWFGEIFLQWDRIYCSSILCALLFQFNEKIREISACMMCTLLRFDDKYRLIAEQIFAFFFIFKAIFSIPAPWFHENLSHLLTLVPNWERNFVNCLSKNVHFTEFLSKIRNFNLKIINSKNLPS